MAFVKQRNNKDCGIAVLAMLCEVTYEEAEKAIPWRKEGLLYGTSAKQLREGALKLGYTTKSTAQNRMKPLKDKKWEVIPNNSLVKIPHPDSDTRMFHWVVWRKGKIYDPARGVFTLRNISLTPSSYMEFIKCEK